MKFSLNFKYYLNNYLLIMILSIILNRLKYIQPRNIILVIIVLSSKRYDSLKSFYIYGFIPSNISFNKKENSNKKNVKKK
jgi:hypothetical protein